MDNIKYMIIVIFTVLNCSKSEPLVMIKPLSMNNTEATHVVWIDKLPLYKKPNLNSAILVYLPKGNEVKELETSSDYIQVKDINNSIAQNFKILMDTVKWCKIIDANKQIGWLYDGGLAKISYYKNKYKIYGIADIFYVKSIPDNKILYQKKVKVNFEKLSMDYKFIYSVNLHQEYHFLIMTGMPCVDPISFFTIIFDLEKKIFIEIDTSYSSIASISPSKKYIIMNSGTCVNFRPSAIYSLEKKEILYSFHPLLVPTNWNSDDSIDFEIYKDGTVSPKNENELVEKVNWKDGKIKRSGIFKKPDFV